MATYGFQLDHNRPYFAEIPYYLWGQANYDSEGDCKRPTDRQWTWLLLLHRETQEEVEVRHTAGNDWLVEANEETAVRLLRFLADRCGAKRSLLREPLAAWDHPAALRRASRVALEFEQSALSPFDSHLFWGSWKWIGWFATDFTWVGRWIMHSVVRNDSRAIPLCIDWLREPPRFQEQEAALGYAIQRLSGEPGRSGKQWVRWYDGGWLTKGARHRYPKPDLDAWLAEMKAELGTGLGST